MTEISNPAAPNNLGRRQLVSMLIGLLVVAFLVFAISRNWTDVRATWRRFEPTPLLGSLGCLVVAFGATWLQWRTVLRAYGVVPPLGESAQVFFVSQLGKYAPGSVWPILIQVRTARRHGARPVTVVVANLNVMGVSLVVGLVIAAITLPFADPATLRRFWWTLAALPLLVALLHPRLTSWLQKTWLRMRGSEALVVTPMPAATFRASAWSCVAWLGYGGHLYLLAMGERGGFGFFVLCTGALALALSAGILFLPAPAGAGVREVVLVAALSTVMTVPTALAIAVASRVLFLCADVLSALLAVLPRLARSASTRELSE